MKAIAGVMAKCNEMSNRMAKKVLDVEQNDNFTFSPVENLNALCKLETDLRAEEYRQNMVINQHSCFIMLK